MNSTTNIEFAQSLKHISDQLNRYLSPSILLFGTVGNILNCLVLSQRRLRTNSCALLFLFSSCVNLISIVTGLPFRILSGWNFDPTSTNHILCKLRAFIVFSTRTMGIWLIALATIDRWLLSCADIHRRQMSTIQNIKRSSLGVTLLGIIVYSHMLYCYEANSIDAPLRCYGKDSHCRLTTDLSYLFVTILIPLILMILFGLFTICNARHIRNRVEHQQIATNQMQIHERKRARKTDYQLLRMLCLDIVFLVLLCIPQGIIKIYFSILSLGFGFDFDDGLENFLYNIGLLLAFIASGMPFYIHTLAGGNIFRREFIDLLHRTVQLCNRRLT